MYLRSFNVTDIYTAQLKNSMNKSTPSFRAPHGKRSARVTFSDEDGEFNVDISLKRSRKGAAQTVQMTLSEGFGKEDDFPTYRPGDNVVVHISDDSIESDDDSYSTSDSESESESESESMRAYGIVMSTTKTAVKVIWFYDRSEFPSVHPPHFARRVKQHTLSTKVSEHINIASIEKVETIPDVSDCIYNVDSNRLEGTYSSVSLYYHTLSKVHAHCAKQGCTFATAVDYAITEKVGMFSSIGNIVPSGMPRALKLFEKCTTAPLPHVVGRMLPSVGETPLAW